MTRNTRQPKRCTPARAPFHKRFPSGKIQRALDTLDQLANLQWPRTETGQPKREGKVADDKLINELQTAGVSPALTRELLKELHQRGIIRKGEKLFRIWTFVSFAGDEQGSETPFQYLYLNRSRWQKFYAEWNRQSQERYANRRRRRANQNGRGNGSGSNSKKLEIGARAHQLSPLEQRVIVALLRHQKTAITKKPLPSQNTIGQWLNVGLGTSIKTALSKLVKLEFIDNGRHHRLTGGYFLTEKGRIAGKVLGKVVPSPDQVRTDRQGKNTHDRLQ